MSVEPVTDETATRPCVHCGRPVPQRGSAGRPFRYCRDNDDVCRRNARNGRMRERNSPGLAGQVARSWELVERLELLTGTLAEALHADLSPVGVERQIAQVRAEAATHVAGVHTERDEARREAESARAEAARLTDTLTVEQRRVEEHTQHLAHLAGELDSLRDAVGVAERARDEARSATAAETALRAEAQSRRDEALAAVETHRSALADAERTRDAALTDRDTARASVRVAEEARHEATNRLTAVTAERDEIRSLLIRSREDIATATEALAGTRERVAALETSAVADRDTHLKTVWERDAARTEVTTLTAAAEAARAENATLTSRIATLTGEVATAQAELVAARAHAGHLTEQVGTVTAALARLGREPATERQSSREPGSVGDADPA